MAEIPSGNPLNEEHLEQLNTGIAAANEGLRQVELAKRAGMDMSQQETELRASLESLRQIKQVYFPNR
jgi:hypothetical protein